MDDYEELRTTILNNIACAEEEAKDLRDIIVKLKSALIPTRFALATAHRVKEADKKRIEELTAVIEGDLESFKMAGELYTARKRIEKLEGGLLLIASVDTDKLTCSAQTRLEDAVQVARNALEGE